MLVIQDPTDEQAPNLLQALTDAFQDAESIAGAFAFVSSSGVRLLTESDVFQEVAQNFPVDLVIGIDAVTNERALDSLIAVSRRFPNVMARAFLNPQPAALFHPKFCFAKRRGGSGHLVDGSGNLTEGGLLGNWEAYSIEELSRAGFTAVSDTWAAWTSRHASSLLPLENDVVRQRVRANTVMAPEGDLPTLVAPPQPLPDPEPLAIPNAARVLIAEIPDNNVRGWNQANFHRDDYVDYFGVQLGVARLFVFRHVNPDGSLGEYERDRPPVAVRSRNWRFELGAAVGIPYPTTQPPIGVFIRMAPFTFFYRLLLPGNPEFTTVHDLLQNRAGPRTARYVRNGRTIWGMRSTRLTVAELRDEWPNSPFWRLPVAIR